MKKYIREILDDLNLTAKPKPPPASVAEGLDNQTLTKHPAEHVRSLDGQAWKNDEREESG